MNLDETNEHLLFVEVTKKYIRDCLGNNATRKQILDSFALAIDEVIKENKN